MRVLAVTQALLELSRPLNVLLSVPVVWLGAALVSPAGNPPLLATGLACLVVVCALGAGNSFNDWADQEEDRLNRPERPLPSGRITPEVALAWAGVQAVNALLLAWKLMELSQRPEVFRLCLFCLLLLAHYALRGKGLALWGNLEVAFLSALAVLYGALALPGFPGGGALWWLAAFSGLLTLLREILKDLQDLPGDRAAGRFTTAVRLGEARAGLLLRVAALAPLLLALLLALQRPRTGLALLLPVGWALWACWRGSRRPAAAQRELKGAMLLGLVLFWLCELGPLALPVKDREGGGFTTENTRDLQIPGLDGRMGSVGVASGRLLVGGRVPRSTKPAVPLCVHCGNKPFAYTANFPTSGPKGVS